MKRGNKSSSPYWVMRVTFGVVPFLAGLDKFFNLLTHWDKYLSPLVQRALPMNPTTFLHLAGIIEMVVGLAILTRWTHLGSYVAALWLVGISVNLLLAGYFDVAVRDLVMAVCAYSLGRLSEVKALAEAPAMGGLRQPEVA
jgi:hypothetical protein